jgi:hypothetical protein
MGGHCGGYSRLGLVSGYAVVLGYQGFGFAWQFCARNFGVSFADELLLP